MAIALELIDAEVEAFHSNVETGSLDDKSPMRSLRFGLVPRCRLMFTDVLHTAVGAESAAVARLRSSHLAENNLLI
jgi:hypothetical protein